MSKTVNLNNISPSVSILMLTYNREKFLLEAVASVLRQTYTNFELIIIDDGSTDATTTLLHTCTDPRITVIRHDTNRGLHVRRAESLKYATGEYTAVLDSDDLWTSPEKLSAQVQYMEAHPTCAVIGTFLTIVDTQSTSIGTNSYGVTDADIRNTLLARNQFVHSGVLMRTPLLQQTDGYRDTDLAEDLDLFLQLGNLGTFANIPQYMTAYRIHTHSFNSQRLRMAKAVLGIIKNHKTYPRYYRAILRAHIRILITRLKN